MNRNWKKYLTEYKEQIIQGMYWFYNDVFCMLFLKSKGSKEYITFKIMFSPYFSINNWQQ